LNLLKSIGEDKVLEESGRIEERIAKYLRLMNLKFEWREKDKVFLVPYKISGRKHVVVIFVANNWVWMRCGIIRKEEIPRRKELELYKVLLKANHDYPEFVFDMDKDGNIGTSQEIYVDALNFDVFEEEFLAIPFAVKFFWEKIAPALGKKEPERTEWIYI